MEGINIPEQSGMESWEDFVSSWKSLQETELSIQWAKGDMANALVVKFGEQSLVNFAQDVDETESSLQHYRRVARAFPKDKRVRNLPWTTFLNASFTDKYNKGEEKFETENRFDWIDKAEDEGWSSTEVQRRIKESEAVEDGSTPYELVIRDVEIFCNRLIKREPDDLKAKEWREVIEKLEELSKNLYSRSL